jgi:hypothetical protein
MLNAKLLHEEPFETWQSPSSIEGRYAVEPDQLQSPLRNQSKALSFGGLNAALFIISNCTLGEYVVFSQSQDSTQWGFISGN